MTQNEIRVTLGVRGVQSLSRNRRRVRPLAGWSCWCCDDPVAHATGSLNPSTGFAGMRAGGFRGRHRRPPRSRPAPWRSMPRLQLGRRAGRAESSRSNPRRYRDAPLDPDDVDPRGPDVHPEDVRRVASGPRRRRGQLMPAGPLPRPPTCKKKKTCASRRRDSRVLPAATASST